MKWTSLGSQLTPRRNAFTLVPREDEPRSPGLHQSDISSKMMRELGHYDDRAMDWERIQIGSILEAVIEDAIREACLTSGHKVFKNVVRPGEFSVPSEVGPIYVTPDGHDIEADAVHEIKATWYSAGKGIDDVAFWPWRIQMQLGCLALDTLVSYLHIFYVNGDWKPPTPWPIHTYRFEWTPTDLVENVECLSNFVRDRRHLFND